MNRKRIQFDLGQVAFEQLEEFKKSIETRTIAEVCRNAMALYKWMVAKHKEGYKLYVSKGPHQVRIDLDIQGLR